MRNEVVLALIATPSFIAAFVPSKPRRGWVKQNVAVDPFSIADSVSTEAGSFFDLQHQQHQQPKKGFLESIIETNNRVFEKESNWLGSIFTVDRIGVVETAEDDTTVDALASEGDWTAYFDREGTALIYYFNSKTGESRWTAPTKTFPEVSLTPAMRKLARDKRQEYIKATKLVEAQVKENGILSALLGPFDGTKEKVEPAVEPLVQEKPIEIVKTDWLSFLTQETHRTPRAEKVKDVVVNESPKALATQGDWSAYWDKSSGFVYFFNAKSGESRWDPPTRNFPKMKLTSSMKLLASAPKKMKGPKPLAEEGDWQAFFDGKDSAIVFYYNTRTGESRWNPPTKTFPKVKMTPSMRDRIVDKRGWEQQSSPGAIVQKNNKNLLDSIVEFIDTVGKSFQDQFIKNDVGILFGSFLKDLNEPKVAEEKSPEKKDIFWFGFFGNQVKPLSAGEPGGQGAAASALALERPKVNLFEVLLNFKPELVIQAVVESLESNPILQLPLSFLHQHDTGATRVIRRGPAHKKKKSKSNENVKK